MATTMSAVELKGTHDILTHRESQVLNLILEGRSSKEVASLLYLSKRTVDFHLSRIYEKLDVQNRLQAARRAAELGLAVSQIM